MSRPPARWSKDPVAMMVATSAAWSLVIVLLTATLPIYTVNSGHAGLQPRHTLLKALGYGVLLPATAPLAVTICVALLLHAARARRRQALANVALVLAGALLAAAAVGTVTFLVGVFVLPVGTLLVLAAQRVRGAGFARPDRRRGGP